MVIKSQKDKERMVCLSIDKYMEQGFKKSEAVRRTMSDFNYSTEAAVYGILRRYKKKGGNDGERDT